MSGKFLNDPNIYIYIYRQTDRQTESLTKRERETMRDTENERFRSP